MKKLFFLAVTFLAVTLHAQTEYSFDTYKGLYCEGKIPSDFLTKTSESYESDVNRKVNGRDGKTQDYQKEFLLSSNYFLRQLMLSGQVSFGDPITNYLNEVKDKVFEDYPELQHAVRIYTVKSTLVNAFANDKGVLFITTGLIARCKEEAELAFVIAHEAAHFELNHMMNGYLENQRTLEREGSYLGFNQIEIQKAIFHRSRKKEFEADSLGSAFMCNSTYDAYAGISGTFDILHKSYLPFEEVVYLPSFLEAYGCMIPSCFFLEEVKAITKEEDYFDKTHTHPNISKRREKLERYLDDCTDPEGDIQNASNSKLQEVVKLAQFETIRQELLNRNYGDAIYHCFILQNKYPQNRFLEMTVGKSLYGLARYKNKRKYSVVGETSNIEGESQQVHFLLKQLSKDQLSTIALKYLWNLQKKYGNNEEIEPLIKGLVRDMVINLDLTPEMYSSAPFVPEIPFSEQELSGFSYRKRTKILQQANKDFHFHILGDLPEDEAFKKVFSSFYGLRDSLENFKNLDYKTKEDLREKKTEDRAENGLGLGITKMILLDPNYAVLGKTLDESDLENEEDTQELINLIKGKTDLYNIETKLLSAKDLSPEDVQLANEMFALKEFTDEALLHNNYGITSTGYTFQSNMLEKYDVRYLCSIQVIGHSKSSNTEYRFIIYDMKQGKLRYVNQIFGRKAKRLSKVEDFIEEDLQLIIK